MTKTRVSPLRAVVRFVASVMMVSGLLLIADAGLTLAWQEPISAFRQGREQATLKRSFRNPPPRVVRRQPLKGDAIAKIDMPSIHKSAFVVQGTDTGSLRKGPGHYSHTPLPGDRGTVAIAGHRTTYGAPFRHINNLKRGQRVIIEMPDGTYYYRVEKTRIVPPTELSVLRKVSYDRLVLTACHPLYSAAKRIVVFARFVRKARPRVKS
jgi:sortase A